MSDPAIGDAIIAGIGAEDSALAQMSAIVTNLERRGFVLIPRSQYDALMAAAKALKRIRHWDDFVGAATFGLPHHVETDVSGHDQDELMRLTEIGNRITEVLAKYNIRLENAPRDALTMAMDRMIRNRTSSSDYVAKVFKP